MIGVGTRGSALARWQTEWVMARLREAWPAVGFGVRLFTTSGDRLLDKPLPEIGGKGVFTEELEDALRAGEIDIAVHSLKDLPIDDAPALTIGAIAAREDARDVLISREGRTLAGLPAGARVGTSSLRRSAQLLAARPDLTLLPLRGNVDTRIGKVLRGDYDAIVLAAAGVRRLGLAAHVTEYLPYEVMLPAPGQGALAVQCRAGDERVSNLLAALDDRPTRLTVTAERAFLDGLGGGCSAPVAAYAHFSLQPTDSSPQPPTPNLHFTGLVASPDGTRIVRVEGQGEDPLALGAELARRAIARGAGELIRAGERTVGGNGAGPAGAVSPLAGKRIVITRPRAQAAELMDRLSALGAVPIAFPTIDITPMEDYSALDRAIERLGRYGWVVFTSVNGVAAFWDRLAAAGKDGSRLLGETPSAAPRPRVAAIGPATAEALAKRGVRPDFVPDEFVAERILDGVGDVSGQWVLLPRADIAREALAVELGQRGAVVHEIAAYRTLPAAPDPRGLAELRRGVDAVTFTSASTVRHFLKLLNDEAATVLRRATIACIGPITAQTLRDAGLRVDVMAERYTVDGLVEALEKRFALSG